MKKTLSFILGIVTCLAVAGGAYLWATGLIDSLYNFRSPLRASPPEPGQPVGPALTRRAVVVLIDALREDTSLKPSVMPYLNELRSQGAWATMHSRPPSYSEPGYSVLMTGAWPEVNDGPAMNLEYPVIPTWTQDNLFSAFHRAGMSTAVSGYYWFEKLIPQQDVTEAFYTSGEDAAADADVMAAALPMLDKTYSFVLIHIDQVDYAGHYLGGPRDPRWDAAATQSDDYLREIAAKLDVTQDTLIVLSDHGQIDRGGHGGQDPITLIEPFVMAGAGIKPGHFPAIQMVDVAPTIAVLLGTNIPASNQGHPAVDMLVLPDFEMGSIQDALAHQQIQIEQSYVTAIGGQPTKVLVAEGQDLVDTYQQAMDEARSQRLNRERIGRFVLAILLALAPALILLIRREKKALWLLGAALLYTLLFNVIYALIVGRTYSLSSVGNQLDIIVSTGIYAAISISLAWLVLMLVRRSFRSGPYRAAASTLAMTLMTIYLLSLPVLVSFALNGVLVTWTLPDLLSMFLGFLSILQGLIVAVIGLLLTGLSAAIAAFVPQARRTQ